MDKNLKSGIGVITQFSLVHAVNEGKIGWLCVTKNVKTNLGWKNWLVFFLLLISVRLRRA
jgi:hypothetical protein